MITEYLLDKVSGMQLFRLFLTNRFLRKQAMSVIAKRTYAELVERNPDNRPRRVQEEKYHYMMGLLHGLERAIERGWISQHVLERVVEVFLKRTFLEREFLSREAAQKIGFQPPLFVTISPTAVCNLKCAGCYAESSPEKQASLEFDLVDRILTEKENLWASYFTVISGGEPFMWRDGNRGLLDLVEKHNTNFFMVYTNGTLTNDDCARRMAELGNITLAISVEGFEAETDARRGKGVFKKIMTAMETLRRHGVPFGISATPTKENWRVISSDRFVDFYFEEQGAIYGWLFQFMPIGRGPVLDLMVPPVERVQMLEKLRKVVRERKIFLADFWNSGPTSSGCISAGRPGGYFYIDWNGDVMPCVFVPYAVANIREVYARGGNLNDVLQAPLMVRIREWQNEYGYAQPAEQVHNWLCPCVVRDHFDVLHKAVLETGARPTTEGAAAAIHDPEFYRGMINYDRALEELTAPIWSRDYAEQKMSKAAN